MADDLHPGQQPPDWKPPKTANKRGIGCAIVVVVLLGAYVFGSSENAKDDAEKAAAVESGPAMTVTPEELRAAYDANEAAAQLRYGDKILQVSGKIDSITLDMTDDPVVQLATSKPYSLVHASFEGEATAQAAQLSKGQTVTLRCGGISEVIGTPMLRNCFLAN